MSSYANNHILYGNYGLSNRRIQVRELAILDGSPNSLQTIPISRGTGSSVVRNRTEARSIKLAGGTTFTNETQKEDSVLEMTDKVKKIFSKQKRLLRTVPKSKVTVLDDCQSTLNWSNSGDAGALSLDQADFEYNNASLKSTVTVSTGSATYNKDITSQDLSVLTNTGNFEFWTYLSDVYNVNSLDFRVGNKTRNQIKKSSEIATANTYWQKGAGLTENGVVGTSGLSGQPVYSFAFTGANSYIQQTYATNRVPASPLQDVTLSAEVRLASGTWSGGNRNFAITCYDSGGTNLGTVNGATFTATATNARYSSTVQTLASTAYIRFIFPTNLTSATLEFSAPQLEFGTTATAYQSQGTVLDNYYSQNITTNYEGLPFENGWNYISVPWGNEIEGLKMTETGTVNDTIIDYTLVNVNYETTAENFTFGLGGLFHVQESFCRNFLCSLDGAINTEPQWYLITDNIKNDFELNLLNYTGYAQATHNVKLFTETAVTTLTKTKKVDLQGTFSPLLVNTFTLNNVTNLTDLRYTNLSSNEIIRWTNSWTAGNILIFDGLNKFVTTDGNPQDFTGKIPSNILGINYLKMDIVTSSAVTVQYVVKTDDQGLRSEIRGQSFTASLSGTLTSVKLNMRINPGTGAGTVLPVKIYSSSGGYPNTLLATNNFSFYDSGTSYVDYEIPFNVSVTNTSVYHIVVDGTSLASVLGFFFWSRDNVSGYPDGKATVYSGGSWFDSGWDSYFIASIEPTPSTNIDWECSYKPLYI